MARKKMCGIYRIENLINHKNYIGQSVDIYDRWAEHKWELNNGKHNNQHLLSSWRKYGADNFEFTIIEQCDENELNEREIYWIEYYDSYLNGYNQTKGGDGCFGKIWTEKERERKSRAILQISLDGKILKRFININDAAKKQVLTADKFGIAQIDTLLLQLIMPPNQQVGIFGYMKMKLIILTCLGIKIIFHIIVCTNMI